MGCRGSISSYAQSEQVLSGFIRSANQKEFGQQSKMTFENSTEGCAMDAASGDHHLLPFGAYPFSLILGVPLAWNVLWHLKVQL